jgi:hypothetical protein
MSIKQKPMKWLKRDTMNSQSGVVITDMQRTIILSYLKKQIIILVGLIMLYLFFILIGDVSIDLHIS